jgi:hypothetical protein
MKSLIRTTKAKAKAFSTSNLKIPFLEKSVDLAEQLRHLVEHRKCYMDP